MNGLFDYKDSRCQVSISDNGSFIARFPQWGFGVHLSPSSSPSSIIKEARSFLLFHSKNDQGDIKQVLEALEVEARSCRQPELFA